MNTLQTIRKAGFQVDLSNDKLHISPAQKLNQSLRDLIKNNKQEIIDSLKAEAFGLSIQVFKRLEQYLDHIEEFDEEMRNELLTECGKNPEALAWALGWINKKYPWLQTKSEPRHDI